MNFLNLNQQLPDETYWCLYKNVNGINVVISKGHLQEI